MRIERIVCDRDLLVDDAGVDATVEVAALLEQAQGAERVVGEVVEEVGDGVRLEHAAVHARLELLCALRPRGLLRRLPRDGGRIYVGGAPGGVLGVPGAAVAGGDDERGCVRHSLLDRETRRRGDRELGGGAREEAVDGHFPGCVDRRRGTPCLLGGPERRCLVVVTVDARRIRRRGEPRKGLVGRRALGRGGRASRELGEPVAVHSVRGRDAGSLAAHDSQRHDEVLDQRRLVHFRAGEAGQAGALRVRNGFRFAAGGPERRAGDVERAHAFTPTWTLRNRAGAAPCDTCALWPGCPLPQFVKP